MKKVFLAMFFLGLSFWASGQKVTVPKLPTTVDEFIELRDKIAQTPEGGATIMIIALITYAQNPELGLPFLTIAIEKDQLTDGKGGYKDKVPSKAAMSMIESQIGKDSKKSYTPNSYIQGTSPDNGYKLPSNNLILEFNTNSSSGDPKSGTFKLFVKSSGADSARPITVKSNDKGVWKAKEWSSLLVGVRPPTVKGTDTDDF